MQFDFQTVASILEPADQHIKRKPFHQDKLKKYMAEKVLNVTHPDKIKINKKDLFKIEQVFFYSVNNIKSNCYEMLFY